MNLILTLLAISLFGTNFIKAYEKITFENIYKTHDFLYEQNSQAYFQMRYPGQVQGILNVSMMQQDYKPTEEQKDQKTDGICNFTTDKVKQTDSRYITLVDLTNNNDDSKILTLTDYDFNIDNKIYILSGKKGDTDTLNVLEVKVQDKQFTLGGTLSVTNVIKDKIDILQKFFMITNKKSKRLYVISSDNIASKVINSDEDFVKVPFEEEKEFKKCIKIEHVLSAEDYLIISCYQDGINTYKVGNNGLLTFKKKYQEKESVYQSEYSEENKMLAYLSDKGLQFIKYNGDFGDVIPNFIIPQQGKVFSQYNMQTFWIKDSNEYSIFEVFADINNEMQQTNGLKQSNRPIIGSYMNDVYGILFNENQMKLYIHSIPSDLPSEYKNEIDTSIPLEDTEKFIVVQDNKNEEITRVISVTQKSLKINTLTYYPPQFLCHPRDDSGIFIYTFRIFSKECDNPTSKELFYQCVTEDTISMKVRKAYVTSSNQNLAIGLGVGLTVFFVSLIGILYICYKKKKVALSEMEEKARSLRQLKYMELQQDKLQNSSNVEA